MSIKGSENKKKLATMHLYEQAEHYKQYSVSTTLKRHKNIKNIA